MKKCFFSSKIFFTAFLAIALISCSAEDGTDGAMGPAGPQGAAGQQGPAGQNGIDGATGPQGPAGLDASIAVTAIKPPCNQSLTSVTTSFKKITDLGKFTKAENESFVEIDYQTNFNAIFTGVGGVIFQVRVDDKATTVGEAALLMRQSTKDISVPGIIHGIFANLNTGEHTVSIWASLINGTATYVSIDDGCFNNFDTNSVIVKEFK